MDLCVCKCISTYNQKCRGMLYIANIVYNSMTSSEWVNDVIMGISPK